MERSDQTDTIIAQATPPGRGGISVLRISGPSVNQIMLALIGKSIDPRQATYTLFKDEMGIHIDAGIMIYFPGPHSFTGEDVLELHGHGAPIVVDLLIQRILRLGARIARPGEFSERAFLNGKIDLTQAEAIADLINASSAKAARSAMRSLQGEFSKKIAVLTEAIIQLRMYIEAAIDFSDEEIDFLSDQTITQQLQSLIKQIDAIETCAKQGSLLRDGITAIIMGEPNVGKSTLLNALCGEDIAIVTDIPGTTRDILRDTVLIDGMPLRIIDTAGLRDTEDAIEQEGIRRAYQELEKSDIVLYVIDAAKNDVFNTVPAMASLDKTLFIYNKIDLINAAPKLYVEACKTHILVSARTGVGIALLKNHIKTMMGYSSADDIFLARRRHLTALAKAKSHLMLSLNQLENVKAGELAAEDLRQAQHALSEITGEFTTEDLLDRIFSSFCVGK